MSPLIGFARGLSEHPKLSEGFRYVWLEGVMEAVLARVEDIPGWNDIGRWPAGRLFGEIGEYRWQTSPEKVIRAVFLLDEGALPEGFEGELTIEFDENPVSELILWGEWVDPNRDPTSNPKAGPLFYSREIPEVQTYPIEPDEASRKDSTPRLVIRRYYHKSEESKGEFIRCAGFCVRGETE